MLPTCQHIEGHYRKDGVFIDKHDCEYVERRNALIPLAHGHADREGRRRAGFHAGVSPSVWNQLFHDEMNRLSRELEARVKMPKHEV